MMRLFFSDPIGWVLFRGLVIVLNIFRIRANVIRVHNKLRIPENATSTSDARTVQCPSLHHT